MLKEAERAVVAEQRSKSTGVGGGSPSLLAPKTASSLEKWDRLQAQGDLSMQ